MRIGIRRREKETRNRGRQTSVEIEEDREEQVLGEDAQVHMSTNR